MKAAKDGMGLPRNRSLDLKGVDRMVVKERRDGEPVRSWRERFEVGIEAALLVVVALCVVGFIFIRTR